MYITILGRQPVFGLAELECVYGAAAVQLFSPESACVTSNTFAFDRLAGSKKAGIVTIHGHGDWRRASNDITAYYCKKWHGHDGKITLGLSAYGFNITARDVQKTGLTIKRQLKKNNSSVRLIPNESPALSTATSHHNKLGLSSNHIELLVVRAHNGGYIIAESIGSQNITALSARDQARPKTDAFVGMLPPKLARIMINLAGVTPPALVFDPFCGTGTVLQEALVLGYPAAGSDLSDKMVRYATENSQWLAKKHHITTPPIIHQADATKYHWSNASQFGAIVCETYLGRPFSAPPSPAKLSEVSDNCNHIISEFLKNIHPQISTNTPLVIAIPSWRSESGFFTHLPLVKHLDDMGYQRTHLSRVDVQQLIYYRESQVVAREILLLTKK